MLQSQKHFEEQLKDGIELGHGGRLRWDGDYLVLTEDGGGEIARWQRMRTRPLKAPDGVSNIELVPIFRNPDTDKAW